MQSLSSSGTTGLDEPEILELDVPDCNYLRVGLQSSALSDMIMALIPNPVIKTTKNLTDYHWLNFN